LSLAGAATYGEYFRRMNETLTAVLCAAEFNKPLVDVMVASASDELERVSTELLQVLRVPGCYELPLCVGTALALPSVQVVVVLGYIERGETQHGEVMGHAVHAALLQQSLAHGKPVGLGIIGPGATSEQAELRKDAYARAAVRAAVASWRSLQTLRALQFASAPKL
jgi:6,7-dimethyl-8-ribityllumazine synthase